jgi:hypothetical protein
VKPDPAAGRHRYDCDGGELEGRRVDAKDCLVIEDDIAVKIVLVTIHAMLRT